MWGARIPHRGWFGAAKFTRGCVCTNRYVTAPVPCVGNMFGDTLTMGAVMGRVLVATFRSRRDGVIQTTSSGYSAATSGSVPNQMARGANDPHPACTYPQHSQYVLV